MKRTKIILLLLACCFFVVQLQAQQNDAVMPGYLNTDSLKKEMDWQKKLVAAQFANTRLQVIITKVADKRFGYYILADGNITIDQKNIPAVPGNKGFMNAADAKRTATLTIKKLKMGEMPPTISVEELKKLKISINRPDH